MRRSEACVLALGGLMVAAMAQACVEGVPWQLFDHREVIREATPVNSFAWAASHLVPAPDPVAPLPQHAGDSYAQRRAAAETSSLSQAQRDAVLAMRAASNARLALVAGIALPASIRLYTAGAVAFTQGDVQSATGYFRQVLGLPSAAAAARAVWATYMLARLATAQGDPAGAASSYRQTRALAAQGSLDPLGLATASLGDEARLRLDAGDGSAAVALYAEQAARGSDEAVQSLRMVAESIMARPERLPAAVRDPLTQRLLVVHALALTGDYLHGLHAGGTLYQIDADGFWPPDSLDTHPLHALFHAIRDSKVTVAGTDQLAALAYQLYDRDAARALAAASSTPLALWIQAKLALQSADNALGARLMAQAVRASAQAGGAASLEPSSVDLLHGEAAVWALGRGDFILAMQVLWPAAWTYRGDVAYLAERVLTTDELKAFVDRHAPVAEPPPADLSASNAVNLIRDLLARRLMREGRYDEAPPYFNHPAQGDADTRADAIAFAKALRRSQGAFWASDRAQAGWEAAVLLRTRGMEMMGTETSPDFGGVRGGWENWGFGPGPGGPLGQREETFVQDELIRYDASRPAPDLRYHYRYLAVDQALRAADELPSRSQASAAILCQAAGWMFSSHADEKAHAIYRRYVGTGAVVPFATHFGRACPEPDFAAVSATREKLATLEVRDAVHRNKPSLAAAALLLAVAGFAAVRARRRRG